MHTQLKSLPLCPSESDGTSSPATSSIGAVSSIDCLCCSLDERWASPDTFYEWLHSNRNRQGSFLTVLPLQCFSTPCVSLFSICLSESDSFSRLPKNMFCRSPLIVSGQGQTAETLIIFFVLLVFAGCLSKSRHRIRSCEMKYFNNCILRVFFHFPVSPGT